MSDSPSEDEIVSDQAPADSETTENTDSSQETSESQDGQTSESSPETAAPKSMLDAVKAAVAPKTAEESPTSEQGKTEADKADPASKEKTDESDDETFSAEEWGKLGNKTKRRIKRFEQKLEAKDQEIGSLKGKASEYDKIETFVRNSGLTNETVGATLQIAALLRHDPREALKRLTPIVDQLRNIVGETLPAELQERVNKGFLTEDDARALARSNAEAAILQRQRAEQAQRYQAEETQRAQRQVVDSTVSTIEQWEANKAKSDPDWNLKRDEIAEQVELEIERENRKRQQTNPAAPPWFPTPDEAVKLSQAAYDKVNERNKRFAPKPREIKPVVPGAASNRNAAAPKSMLDVVRQTVGAS